MSNTNNTLLKRSAQNLGYAINFGTAPNSKNEIATKHVPSKQEKEFRRQIESGKMHLDLIGY